MDKCPICQTEVKEDQSFCIKCGRNLKIPVTYHCPECFKDVTTYDRVAMEHCPHCGEEVNEDRLITDEEVPQARKLKALR